MPRIAETFDGRAAKIKATLNKFENDFGKLAASKEENKNLLSAAAIRENILLDMQEAVQQANSLRNGNQTRKMVEYDLETLAKLKFGFGSVDGFFGALNVDPSATTMVELANMGDFPAGYKWLIPEIVREAIRLGYRREPIYRDFLAAEESVSQPRVILPSVNMSDAIPERIDETETIPVGKVSFNEKEVRIRKMGTGLKISDEVAKYVPMNILSLYMQDVGVQLNLGIDTLAIDTLLNGEQEDGSMAAPVIGVEDTAKGIQYVDLLRAWIRLGRMGRNPSGMLSNEDPAIKILQFDEFKGANYANVKQRINFKTPVPQSQDYRIHGAMPETEVLGIVAKQAALLKLNASALLVESERIVERGLTGTYATITTGFAKMFRDSFLLIDGSLPYATNKFPDWMNVSAAEKVLFS